MYKYIKSFKHEVNGVLIRQMHFHIFILSGYQLIFKDPVTVLNVSRLPLLCLTLLKYIWKERKRFILKYYSSEN